MSDIRTVWEGRATLAEGPVWDAARSVLWFVDIKQRKVHRLDPHGGRSASWDAPAQVGWVLPATDGALIAGLQTGLHRFDPESGAFDLLAQVEAHLPGNRLNDATTAADGSIWFGSMDDGESARSGQFYRWDGRAVTPLAIAPVCITNGPALSPAQTTLYHVDTVGGIIHASSVGPNGAVGATRVFATIDPADGHPDGCVTDSAGNVWVGLWGGERARLYAPDGGILREVRLPAANITKIALGGAGLKTAFATSARAGLDEAALAAQPLAGSVFAFDVDVPGNPAAEARIAG